MHVPMHSLAAALEAIALDLMPEGSSGLEFPPMDKKEKENPSSPSHQVSQHP